MDTLDKKILLMLQDNARESFANIGKVIGLSAPAIGKRVRQLEDEGVIEGYNLKVNHAKMGIDIKAYITLKLGCYESFGARKEEVAAFPEVQSCSRVTGDDCMILLTHFRNNAHLIEFLENLSKFGDTRTSIILEV